VPFPCVIGTDFDVYPYTRYLTAKTALLDYANGIDTVIVGIDLLPRFALYWEMVTLFGLRPVEQVFLPRLRGKGELDNVSKTNGAHKIATYRDAGWKPKEVIKLLKMSCLDDPDGEWDLRNIKPTPQVVL
jgi:glutamyl/glutaminyl-tRNA synthetase